ncbi:DNA replication complex GINS protein PSF1-like [Zophobas morio]|uniref:DNA replication complex GINS protein PSF1-like n=1 Tax=Zophobas morio TaxID=2755281 RepID=UPI003083A052
MLSSSAFELVKELKRTPGLPPYDEDNIRKTIEEINSLVEETRKLRQEDPDGSEQSIGVAIVMHFATIQRSKRCVLAYLMERIRRIQSLRFEHGSILAKKIKDNLSSSEQYYFSQYNQTLNAYMADIDFDLTVDLQPPTDLYIHVRALVSHGEIQTEHGPITLIKNHQYFVRRSDVEPLIHQGLLVHVTEE